MWLYSFDGYGVHTIWQRDKLNGGRVKVNGITVTLDSIDWDDRVTEQHEILHVAADGLQ